MMERYCDFCNKKVEVTSVVENRLVNIDGVEFSFDETVLRCPECGNEVYDAATNDDNVRRANAIYRDKIGLIQVTAIEELLAKYNIGKKPLAELLGWGEVTLIRYCEGVMPKKEYSDLLKSLRNPFNMLRIYGKAKDSKILTDLAKKKLLSGIIREIVHKYPGKLYGVVAFFLSSMDEEGEETITPLKLQKLIYYVQAWSLGINDKTIFDEDIVAWEYGPVVNDIYQLFKAYHREHIPKVETFDAYGFSDEELQLLFLVKKVYGKYDAFYLKDLTHNEEPWKNARNGCKSGEQASPKISVGSMRAYYQKIAKKYDIKSSMDVDKVENYVHSISKY